MWILFGKALRFYIETLDQLQEDNLSLKSENAFLREQLIEERNERRELSELILQKTGFKPQATIDRSAQQLQPIGRAVSSWPEIKNKLEMNARKKGVPLPEKSRDWTKEVKETQQEVENLIREEENAGQVS